MKFYKKPFFYVPLIILVFAAAGYFYFFRSAKTAPDYIVVKKSNIIQEVSVTGSIKPVKSVDLAFEKSGRISSVLADVGNYVSAEEALVKEDSSELSAQLEKAKADLETQRADSNKSEIVLNNYYSAIPDILNDSYIKADDAVRKQAGSMFTNAESDTPVLSFSSTNSQAVTDSQNGRLALRAELNAWRSELNGLNAASSNDDLFEALAKSKAHLSVISLFLVNLSDALEKSAGLAQSTLDSYKASVTTGRTNINTAFTNITDQNQNIGSQKATVASEEASIKSYQASVNNIEAQIAKTVLYAPISGVVTRQDAKEGEIAAANGILVSILSSSNEIEANVAEADIAKIKISDSASITLDAYGKDVVFQAKVSAIDPAETVIEGVATYKTTFKFVSVSKPVKPGMTANIDILAAGKENVIVVPQRAVIDNNGEKFVRIYNAEAPKSREISEVKVSTGLKGSDGNVEITEGLKEGDKVITSYQQ